MDIIFQNYFIRGNELLFFSFIGLMIITILLILIYAIKETKNVHK